MKFAGGVDAQRVVQRDVFKAKTARGDIVGTGFGDGRAGHFDAQQRRHAAVPGAVDVEETLVACQRDAEAGAAQGRRIPLQQRMPRRRGLALSGRALRRKPVAFAREGIPRQRDASRLCAGIQSGPRDVDAPGPMFGDPRVVALRDPGLAAPREIGVRPAGGEKFPAFSHTAAIELRSRVGFMDACLRSVGAAFVRQRLQLALQIVQRCGDQHDALVHRLTPDLQRVGQRRQIDARAAALYEGEQLADFLLQLIRRARRKRQQTRAAVPRVGACRGRRFLHDQMGIGATRAKRRNAGDARNLAGSGAFAHDLPAPCGGFALQPERRGREIDLVVDLVRVQGRHQLAMPQLQQDLGQCGDAGCRFAVADVGFQRADGAMLPGRAVGGAAAGPERAGQARDFDRVAQRGSGAVRFDVAHVRGIDVGARKRGGHYFGLGDGIGHRVTVRAATGVQGAALDHGMDGVAVAQRLRQRLQHHRTDAFGIDEAVGVAAEGAALRPFRQHPQSGEFHHVLRIDDQTDGAGDRGLAHAAVQAVQRDMDRGERRRAGAVHRERRTGEIEQERDPVGHRIEQRLHGVARIHHPDEHADLAARSERRRRVAAVLDRVIAGFQEQAFLRIDLLRFLRRDPEEQRIELVDVVEETGPAGVAFAGLALLGIVIVLPAPTVGGDFARAAAPGRQVVPERFEIGRLRIAAADADDGNIEAHSAVRRCVDRRRCVRCGPHRQRGRCVVARRQPAAAGAVQRLARRARGERRHGRRVPQWKRSRSGGRHRSRMHGRRVHGSRMRDGFPIVLQEMRDQAVDALHFEKQRAARARKKLAEMRGELHDQDAVQPVLFQRLVGFDLGHVHPQRARDHFPEQQRAARAQCGIVGRNQRGGTGRQGCRRGHPGFCGCPGRRAHPGRRGHGRRRRGGHLDGRRVHGSRVRHGCPIVFQEIGDQAVDALHFEKQRAARARKKLAEMRGELHDQDAVQPVLFQRLVGFDLGHVHPQRARDHFPEQQRAARAQCGIVGRNQRGGTGRQGCRRGHGRRRRGGHLKRCGRRQCGDRRPSAKRRLRGRSRRHQPLANHAVASRRQGQLAQPMICMSREADIEEAFGLQQRFPLRRRQARAAGQAQLLVLVQPPAIEQAEREMRVPRPCAELVDQQHATALQQRLGVAHRLAHVGSGVQHVGRDHRVVAIALDRLERKRFSNIEDRSAQRRELRLIDLLRMQQEGLGQVGVAILFDQVAETAQHRQQPRGGAAGTGTDFEQAQAALAARGPGGEFRTQALAKHPIEVIGDQVVLVDALDQAHRRIGEHHVGGGQRSRQDFGQPAQAGFDQDEIGAMVDVLAPARHRRVPTRPQRFDGFVDEKTAMPR